LRGAVELAPPGAKGAFKAVLSGAFAAEAFARVLAGVVARALAGQVCGLVPMGCACCLLACTTASCLQAHSPTDAPRANPTPPGFDSHFSSLGKEYAYLLDCGQPSPHDAKLRWWATGARGGGGGRGARPREGGRRGPPPRGAQPVGRGQRCTDRL
jgi:hypothetical protein